jgi:antitoxin YefM
MRNLSAVIPASDARINFYKILDEVNDKFRQFTITLRGKTKAVIMSAEEFASWQETLDLMSNPVLRKSIKIGLSEINRGKEVSEKQANKILNW